MMVLCTTTICNSDAVSLVYWPGSTVPMCEPCAARARVIAQVMGFALPEGSLDPLIAKLAEDSLERLKDLPA